MLFTDDTTEVVPAKVQQSQICKSTNSSRDNSAKLVIWAMLNMYNY